MSNLLRATIKKLVFWEYTVSSTPPCSYYLRLIQELFLSVRKTKNFLADTWKWVHDQFLWEHSNHSWQGKTKFSGKHCAVVMALSDFFYWQWQRTLSDGIVLYLFKWLFHSLWRNRRLFRSAAFDLALLYHFVKQFCTREQSSLLWHDVSNSGCSINRIIIKRVH